MLHLGASQRLIPERRLRLALASTTHASVGQLSRELGISVRQVERLCRAAYGRTPKRLLNEQRLLRTLLAARERGGASLSATIEASYADYSHFCRECRTITGRPPRSLLQDGEMEAVIDALRIA